MFNIPIVNHSIKYNPSLDGIRGIAILMVVLFHIWPKYFYIGYMGVDLFFILSGYLISQIIYIKLQNKSFSLKEFYRNRIRRIFPALILLLLMTLIFGYLLMFSSDFKELGHQIRSSAFFYQNFLLMHKVGYWEASAIMQPLLHLWSLAIEEQFYLIWPFIIILVYITNGHVVVKFFLIFVLLLSIKFFVEIDNFYHPLARFWELSLGGLLFSVSYSYNLYISKKNILFTSPILVFLGVISFPLYLWHYTIISFLHIFGINVQTFSILIIVISILFSYLTYRYIEVFFRNQNNYTVSILLLFMLMLIGFTGNYIYHNNGLSNRSFLVHENKSYEKQFIRSMSKNSQGVEISQKLLKHSINNDYVKSTSADLSKKFIAIIGDSHAFALYSGFSKKFHFKGYETILIANSSCPPYINSAMGNNLHKISECKEKIENIYTIISRIPHLQKVIFATRGTIYYKGIGYGTIDMVDKQNIPHLSIYFNKETKETEQLAFTKSIDKTFEFFNKKTYKVYYLLENPELGFSPKHCIISPFGLFKKNCKISLNDFLTRQIDFRSLIYKLAKKYSNINILDPKNFFCDSQYCYAIKNHKMLYLDDDHISKDGSKMLSEYFEYNIFKMDIHK